MTEEEAEKAEKAEEPEEVDIKRAQPPRTHMPVRPAYLDNFNDIVGQKQRHFNRLRYLLWVYEPYLTHHHSTNFQHGDGWHWTWGNGDNVPQGFRDIFPEPSPEGVLPLDLIARWTARPNINIKDFLEKAKLNSNHFTLGYWFNKIITFENEHPLLINNRQQWEADHVSNLPADPFNIAQITFPIAPLNTMPFARSPMTQNEIWMVIRYTAVQAFIQCQNETSQVLGKQNYQHKIDEMAYKKRMRNLIIAGEFLGDPNIPETGNRIILEKRYNVSVSGQNNANVFADIVVKFPDMDDIVIIEAKVYSHNYSALTKPVDEHKHQLIKYVVLEKMLNNTPHNPPQIIPYLIYFSKNGVSFWKLNFDTYSYELICRHQVA